MRLLNSSDGYGAIAKTLHWVIALLFAFQLASAHIMTRMDANGTVLGATQNGYYNWHKSIGILALLLAVARLAARKTGQLPDWAPTLSESERKFIHRAEQALYTAMFLMPVSGFLYVMAGGYGVLLFGAWALPNPIGALPWLASTARWTHSLAGWLLVLTLAGHIGLVLRHQLLLKDGLLRRMLPARTP